MLVKHKDAKVERRKRQQFINQTGSTMINQTDPPPYGKIFIDEKTGMEFIWIPGGRFSMGDLLGDHKDDGWLEFSLPVRRVQVRGFYLGRYAVSQKEWVKIMWVNPSRFQSSPFNPVETISWNDVQTFIKKLSSLSGREYSLPSEAQWEYAAREGENARFGTGKDTIGPSEANFDSHKEYQTIWSRSGEYRGKTVEVDMFQPNAFGLYQMSGNVWEWCQDIWHGSYDNAPEDDSSWEDNGDSSHRVVRGGSWYNYPFKLHTASRFSYKAGIRFDNLGFRLAFNVE